MSTSKQTFTYESKLNHVKNWQSSGQTLSEYCRANKLGISTLSTWVSKLKNATANFKEVEISKESPIGAPQPALLVNVRGYLKLYFKDITDIKLIASLLRELE